MAIDDPVVAGAIRIVVLNEGWVYVGRYFADGWTNRWMDNAFNVRVFGTVMGLGQIAFDGPTINTQLDPCPRVRWGVHMELFNIDCVEAKWKAILDAPRAPPPAPYGPLPPP